MAQSTFKGGVHPYDGKELSRDLPIQIIEPKGELVFPVSQSIGAPAKPLVEKGDTVLVGQKIAEAGGFVGAPVICSVSGTVKGIEPRLVANGTYCNSIIVENDGEYRAVEGFGEERNYESLSKDEIRDIIREAGIVGLGGAGFPTSVKLAPKNEDEIDHIIVNGAECEPYLTSDYRLMIEQPEKLIGGLKVVLKLFDKAKGVIAIEDNKPDAIKLLTDMVKDEPRITVCPLKTKYPQGGERFIIYAVTGRQINSSMLPADAGCIVDNVDTMISIYNAVCLNIPLIRKIVTISGDAVVRPQNFQVRLGSNYQEAIDAAGGFKEEPEKILSGGPMMGQALFSTDIPVMKTSSSLTCFTKDQVAANAETPCIRCGKCVSACPEHLVPVLMMDAAKRHDVARFGELGGAECCECGSCAFICPAHRPLTQAFKEMRKELSASKKK